MAKRDDEFEGRDTVTLTLDDDSELEWLPDYAKDAIRAWREEDTEDEDSEQREWVDDVEDRVNSRSSTLPDDEDSFFDIENIPF